MNCNKCKQSIFDVPDLILERVNETGVEAIWWCHNCLKEHEPELYKNIMNDKTQAEKGILNTIRNK